MKNSRRTNSSWCLVFASIPVLVAAMSCSSTSFSGNARTKDASSVSPAVGQGADSAAKNLSTLTQVLNAECTAEKLPDPSAGPIAPVEMYNWHASGATAAWNQVMSTPVVGLLGNDKLPSIVTNAFDTHVVDGKQYYYWSPGYTYAINGPDGSQKWVSEITTYPIASPAIGDIDGDGKAEVVVFGCIAPSTVPSGSSSILGCVDYKVYALDGATGKRKIVDGQPWVSQEADTQANFHIMIADVDGDGKPEVIANTKVFDGRTGGKKFNIPGGDPIVYDTHSDKGLEIIAATGVYRGTDGSEICHFATPIHRQAAARLRASDGFITVIGNGTVGGVATAIAYKATDCSLLWQTTFPGGGGGAFNMADFDGDGVLEMGSAGSDYYVVFKADGSLLWSRKTQDHSSGVSGSTTFDFNGDGQVEVIYNDERMLRVYDGKTGTVIYETANSSGTLYENPVIADINGDGHAKIIVAANDYAFGGQHGIRVFRAPQNDWVGTRMIWNQHAYYVTNVTDDGRVTGIDKEALWQKRVASEHLLGFRNNVPTRDITPECRRSEASISFDWSAVAAADKELSVMSFSWKAAGSNAVAPWPAEVRVLARCRTKDNDVGDFVEVTGIKPAGTDTTIANPCAAGQSEYDLRLATSDGNADKIKLVDQVTVKASP